MIDVRYSLDNSVFALLPHVDRGELSTAIFNGLVRIQDWSTLRFQHLPGGVGIGAADIQALGQYHNGVITLDSQPVKARWSITLVVNTITHEMLHHVIGGQHFDQTATDHEGRVLKKPNLLHSYLGRGFYDSLGPNEAAALKHRYPGGECVHPYVYQFKEEIRPLIKRRRELREQRDEAIERRHSLKGAARQVWGDKVKAIRQEINMINSEVKPAFVMLKHIVKTYGRTHSNLFKWQNY